MTIQEEFRARHPKSAALELERPEPVERADVERASAVQVAGEQLRGQRAQVDLAGRDVPSAEVDRGAPNVASHRAVPTGSDGVRHAARRLRAAVLPGCAAAGCARA